MKILIDPTLYSDQDVVDIIQEANKTYKLILGFTDKKRSEKFKKYESDVVTVAYRYEYEKITHDKLFEDKKYDDVIDIVHYILRDESTALFYDRGKNHFVYGSGMNHFYRYISQNALKYFLFNKKYKPDFIFFASTPHQIESWISALVAEKMNIELLLPHSSPVSCRAYFLQGLRRKRTFCELDPKYFQNKNIQKITESYVKKIQSTYQEAMPVYELAKFEKTKGKYFNWFTEIQQWWKSPHRIINKYRCYKHYVKVSSVVDTSKQFIVFFPHYQPERTSLPEGFGFTQQIIAIKALRIATPESVEILVKEHPSTFTNHCDPAQRHPTFYEQIAEMEGVRLVNLDIDPFTLIDRSIAVSTLTGTVGTEAMLRGKPAIYFGLNFYKDVFGVHEYKSIKDLREFILRCMAGLNEDKIINEAVDSLLKNLANSIPSDGKQTNKKLIIGFLKGKVGVKLPTVD